MSRIWLRCAMSGRARPLLLKSCSAGARRRACRHGHAKGAAHCRLFAVGNCAEPGLRRPCRDLRVEGSNGDRELAAASLRGLPRTIPACRTSSSYKGCRTFLASPFAEAFPRRCAWLGQGLGRHHSIQSCSPAAVRGFRDDPRKFTPGVCNGAQLLTLLGFVPTPQGQPASSATTRRIRVEVCRRSHRAVGGQQHVFQGHGGQRSRHLGCQWRRPRELARARGFTKRATPLRRRRCQCYGGISLQSKRFTGWHFCLLLRRRTAPCHDAAP